MRLSQKGFSGMRLTRWPSAQQQDMAYALYNMLPEHPTRPSAAVTRPGQRVVSTQVLGVTDHVWQYLGHFQTNAGTHYTVAICDGKFYTLDWTTLTWTEVLTAANLAAASITLSATATVYCTVFDGTLIVSDGVNVPWRWDGTTGGGLTRLTNCPALYGQPTVYYAKLFGILASDRSTVVWSEENDPTTGYETGGYNNAWTLTQTSSVPLVTLLGTNTGLYVFRTTSISIITGAVNSDFRTTGTQDAISTKIGTTAPGSVLLYDQTVYFADQQGRPHTIVGGTVVPIWLDMERVFTLTADQDESVYGSAFEGASISLTTAGVAKITSVALPSLGLVFFAFADPSSSDTRLLSLYGYSVYGRGLQTYWEPYTNGFYGTAWDTSRAQPVILCGDRSGITTSWGLQGQYYQDWSADQGTYVGISQAVIGTALAHTDDVELRFPRMDLTYVPYGTTTFSSGYLTSRQQNYGTAPTQNWSVTGGGLPSEVHKSIGLAATGRWLMPFLSTASSASRLAILGWTVEAMPRNRRPAAA